MPEQIFKVSNTSFLYPGSMNGKTILVDTSITLRDTDVKEVRDVKFIFEKGGAIYFDKCSLHNCSFQGLKDYNDYGEGLGIIHIGHCRTVNQITINFAFKRIGFFSSIINEINDNSKVVDYDIADTEYHDFIIKGSCRQYTSRGVFYGSKISKKKSVFDKEIFVHAICQNVIFDAVKLNPFYFAVRCKDKSSLDLTRATLIDGWSKLRKEYSGVRLFIIFFLTLAFFLPLLAKSFFILVLNNVKDFINVDHVPLWKALVFGGKDGGMAYIYLGLTILLLLYNIGRFFLTISIAKLKEEEKFLNDANFTLVSIHPDKISKHIKLHKALQVLLGLAIIYSVFKIIDVLFISVPWIIS